MTTIARQWDPLPPEVLAHIIHHLPREARRTCLSVSRSFHDLALRAVFSGLTIHFGAWENHYFDEVKWDSCISEEGEAEAESEYQAQASRRNEMSAEILHRIMFDPYFANAVKRLEVCAYEGYDNDCAFQLRCLSMAISYLHNLRALVWYGSWPLPAPEIVDALAKACPSFRRLSLPHRSFGTLPLGAIENLQSVTLSETHLGEIFKELQNMPAVDIGAARDLQELHHPALPLDSIPPHVLPHLTHLELLQVAPTEIRVLGPFLQQLPRLQSLTIICSRQSVDLLLHALAQARGRILRLTSLALIDQGEIRVLELTSGELQMLLDVFKQLPALRRFRTSFLCDYEHWAWFSDGLSALKDLEVLGLDLKFSEAATRDTINTWTQRLPSGLTALSISANTARRLGAGCFQPLWSRCGQLEYLHTWFRANDQVEDLIIGARSLKLLGCEEQLYDIGYKDGAPIVSARWPLCKVVFRRDEYGCAGWEWLMRHVNMFPNY